MRLILGDCIEAMRGLEACSVDAVVTDPPYGINFMGKAWDGKAIEEAASQPRELGGAARLTGSPDSPNRKLIERTGSGFANRAGEAGAYDFTVKGNRAFQQWTEAWALEAYRVLRPGGHMLVFGGTRTYHRMAAGIEDAGFEIRDCLAWMYGSGFPKSLDVSKAIDAKAGAVREVVGPSARHVSGKPEQRTEGMIGSSTFAESIGMGANITAPATPDAQTWQGWGTALKPAFEPVVVARKPLTGTVAANVLAHGTGALNVDGCRIETEGGSPSEQRRESSRQSGNTPTQKRTTAEAWELGQIENRTSPDRYMEARSGEAIGRWPANVVLDEEAASLLDEQSGASSSTSSVMPLPAGHAFAGPTYGGDSGAAPAPGTVRGHDDTGGASRFFYCAKVSRAERNAGLEGFSADTTDDGRQTPIDNPYLRGETERRNIHPTVKPIALMRWLVRLVTPPGGLVLDPFLGSGTTGAAAVLEGMDFIGCEREPDYMPIAQARIAFWAEHGEDGLRIVRDEEAAEAKRETVRASGQLDLLSEDVA